MIVFVTPLALLVGLGLYFIVEKLPNIIANFTPASEESQMWFLVAAAIFIGGCIWSFNY